MNQPETRGFETETQQLLQLMIHSLYSNQEIFLRELISNASDALDRLRLASYSNEAMPKDLGELAIWVESDADAGTVTVIDNGIGMSREDAIRHLGTIAHSGTGEFAKLLQQGKEQGATDANLIGQFGVGFYASFIVADRVTVESRRADLAPDQGVRWASAGDGEYTVEDIEREPRGTRITLHLRDDAKEFLDPWRLRSIIHRYSDHVPFPIYMPPANTGEQAAEGEEAPQAQDLPAYEIVNKASALWRRPAREITDDEYRDFYREISYDAAPPLAWVHRRMEGKTEYTLLLYVPTNPPFDLWDRERRHGVKLYVKRVFIMDDADQLLPAYLRFVRGLVDCDDLPLNVSREILQNNRVVETMRAGCTRRVLDLLGEMAEKETDKYAGFWQAFGRVLKEGVVEDGNNKERIAKLLRFASTASGDDSQSVSLTDYIGRMAEGQKHIYYITADNYQTAATSPHLEALRARGLEVLLLTDPIDEWLVDGLGEFDGHQLKSVAKGELELPGDEKSGGQGDAEAAAEKDEDTDKAADPVIERLAKVLGDQVEAVRASTRLTDSPACLVTGEHAMSAHLQRIMEAAGQSVPTSKPTLEVNLGHALLRQLKEIADDAAFADWASLIYEQALLSEGGHLPNPGDFVKRVNRLLLDKSAAGKTKAKGSARKPAGKSTAAGKKTTAKAATKADDHTAGASPEEQQKK